jgi:hypothetical protein
MVAAMIEVVGMVYRSPEFVRFLGHQAHVPPGIRIVANNPSDAVLKTLDLEIARSDVYHDPNPTDHYLKRVYRCWNYCVESSDAEYVCLVNSDMAFSPGWLSALERRLDGKTLPVSRLVEPEYVKPNGHVLTTGQHGIAANFGRDPRNFSWEPWFRMANDVSEDRVEPGGLFMPCVLHRETFLRVGGYPHGNVGGISGDKILFDKMAAAGFQHVTCFDSLVYHMQEGEMRYGE